MVKSESARPRLASQHRVADESGAVEPEGGLSSA